MMYRVFVLALLAVVIAATAWNTPASAADDIVIRSFDARYELMTDGSFRVTEDITVDFANNERHGIFRDIPSRYPYDSDQDRLASIGNVTVTDGSRAVQSTRQVLEGTLRLRIGDPDVTISGVQRYVLVYVVRGGINAQPAHDELYWNTTGNDWEYTIERASTTVILPAGAAPTQVACFQGPRRSTQTCDGAITQDGATFRSTSSLQPGSGLTIVVGVPKGVINVPPPVLVERLQTPGEIARAFLGLNTPVIAGTIALSVVVIAGLARLWWRTGRDRWLGDNYYLNQGRPNETIKPPFSHETVLPEYEPPTLRDKRRDDGSWDRLTPAEIGVLLDERADTLDVSATVVDLAVRGYLHIEDITPDDHGPKDYKLTRLRPADPTLHPFESALLEGIFDDSDEVILSSLHSKGALFDSLIESKDGMYKDAVTRKFFARRPESTRTAWTMAGISTAVVGVSTGVALGVFEIGALLAVPVVVGGIALWLLSSSMPRRTGLGREMLRRSLGFRLFLVTAEEEHERFNEDLGIFSKFLPYAIVFHCVDKWAKAFEDAATVPLDWYSSRSGAPFRPVYLPVFVSSFSSSMSSSMASLGAIASGSSSSGWSSGFSGFSGGGGGGFSGGGGGGGGGGSW